MPLLRGSGCKILHLPLAPGKNPQPVVNCQCAWPGPGVLDTCPYNGCMGRCAETVFPYPCGAQTACWSDNWLRAHKAGCTLHAPTRSNSWAAELLGRPPNAVGPWLALTAQQVQTRLPLLCSRLSVEALQWWGLGWWVSFSLQKLVWRAQWKSFRMPSHPSCNIWRSIWRMWCTGTRFQRWAR